MTEPVTFLDGRVTLFNADMRDVLDELGRFDALVTDPPYGIKEAAGKNKSRDGYGLAPARDYGTSNWDDAPDLDGISKARSICRHHIIFGGNYYPLTPTSCWLVWDKLNGDNDFADCELAWTNLQKAVRRIQYRWNGMIRQNNEPRGDHPTQKPVGVMRWAIEQLPPDTVSILDPYAGSGTTGVAAVQLGKSFTGIEREAVYFDAMCRRIEEATRQPDMFVEPPPKPKQESMFGDAA